MTDLANRKHYRPDIDGLRAFAILPVLCFHVWPDSLPNGYLGVDIFFVISGYLIYTILLRDFGEGRFNFGQFWIRRVRRLFPAASVMSIVTLLMGYFILQAEEWKSLTQQTVAAFTCSSNFYMWKHANNYWGESSASMPLLHMWSLAVEEQFYIVFPLGLWICLKLNHRPNRLKQIFFLHLFLGASSLILCWYAATRYRSAGFYLLPTRAWEILLGCCAAILQQIGYELFGRNSLWRRILPDLGLIMILAAFLIPQQMHRQSPLLAATCCAGTVLNLFRDHFGTVGARILGSPPATLIGRLSYSLYLWHWPVIVLGEKVADFSGVEVIVLTFILALLSYLLIEQSTRTLAGWRFRLVFGTLSGILCVSASLPYVLARPGVAHDQPELMRSISLIPANRVSIGQFSGDYRTGVVIGDRGAIDRIDVLILGDSHAIMFFPAIRNVCERSEATLSFYGAGDATSPFFVLDGHDPSQYFLNAWTEAQRLEFDACRKDFIRKHKPRLIFVCAKWSNYGAGRALDNLRSHLSELVALGPESQFVFVLQPPELPIGRGGFYSGTIDRPRLRRYSETAFAKKSRETAHTVIAEFVKSHSRCTTIETETEFTDGRTIRFMDGARMLYCDDNHLSVIGAIRCSQLFEKAIETTLGKP